MNYFIEKDSTLSIFKSITSKHFNENNTKQYDISKSIIDSTMASNIINIENDSGKAILFTSIPAVDKKAGLAILYLEINCGIRCGGGSIVFLIYNNGKWQIFKEVTRWES